MASPFQPGAGVQIMPGVYTREIDLTQTVSSSASSQSAIAGVFAWGPVNAPQLIASEDELVARYGKPSNANFETWFSAANFLAYADQLWVNRVVDANAVSAVVNTAAVNSLANHTIYNQDDFEIKEDSFETAVKWIAKYPGTTGNSLRIAVCASADQYESTVAVANNSGNTSFNSANTKASFTVGSNTATITVANTAALTGNTPMAYINAIAAQLTVGDNLAIGNTLVGTQTVKITSVSAPVIANTTGTNTGYASVTVGLDQPVKLADDYATQSLPRSWEFKDVVSGAPTTSYSVAASGNTAATDEMHVVVVDQGGKFTGRPNAVIDVYSHVSRATDAKSYDGESNYYKTVINNNSPYVWAASDMTGLASNTSTNIANATTTVPQSFTFAQGTDGADESNIAIGTVGAGYTTFANKDLYRLSSLIVGKTRGGSHGELLFNYIIDNVAEVLQTVLVFGSVARGAVVTNLDPLTATKSFRAGLRRSSYASCDSGYKYQLDRYNDVYRYVPMCGDIAGISARTDVTNDPWYSPAGYNRGQIKNIVKLAWNPSPAQQTELFAIDINPVVSTATDGTYLLGDKTLLGQNSAFNSIGVRKLFNVIKVALANASKALLFEQNDEFSQSRFRNLTEPYLRDIRGRRGITDFKVVCDDTNNTVQVKSNYQFVGDVYIRPTRSIRYIHLNMIAVNNIADFTESQ